MKRSGIYPGTFDPITNGHLDLIRRWRAVFDRVVVAVARNPQKGPLYTARERLAMAREAVADDPGIEVVLFDELGAKRPTAWVEETIFSIVNHRYNRRKLTLFTSNFLDSEDEEDRRQPMFKKPDPFRKGDDSLVDRIGYRLRSRIYEMCKIVPMEGEDYRKLVKQAGYRF